MIYIYILLLIQDERNSGKGKFQLFYEKHPIPTKDSYRKNLIFKLESFIKRKRWKAFFFDKNSECNEQSNINFGFNLVKTPPKNEHLNAFEDDLYDMVRNIEFENVKSSFQQQLQSDVKSIKKDPKLLIPADKANNLYRLTADEYNKLLTENIFKSYKTTDKSSLNSINTEAKKIAKDLKQEDKIEQHSQHQSFITLKYHKDNFHNNPKGIQNQ